MGLNTQINSLQSFKVSFHITGNAAIKVFDKQMNEIFSGNVGTGMKVRLYKNNILNEEFTVVLYGDIDGDGLIQVNDLILFKKHSLGQFTADRVERKALNFDKDEENKVTIIDMLLVKQVILNF